MSAVVVAWNSGDSLAHASTRSATSARDADEPFQLVVVDNGSTDDAVDELGLLEDGDVVIRNPVNAGYGVAATQGIARSSAPWVLLVNPDLVVEPTFVGHSSRPPIRRPERRDTGAEMRFASRPDLVNCRGVTSTRSVSRPRSTPGSRRPADRPVDPPLGGSSGCCLLRAEYVRRLGGLEPAFFAYLEDVDLALRLAAPATRPRSSRTRSRSTRARRRRVPSRR